MASRTPLHPSNLEITALKTVNPFSTGMHFLP
ncbi:hypothetical protein E2C01_063712 [Portunus trituberculatus]|uniref:Uncharacterized protein n=1 Tax=Portunus trituberculatus TaxID=210409 RepID=A0A5B7HHT8_PORTR|nr:hypothetical protein [Portunus trituberculatus]